MNTFKILLLSLLLCGSLAAQVSYAPKKILWKGQEYFIYPVRGKNLTGVPPTGFSIPDGKYVIFDEYRFKRNRLKKKMVLLDTTRISGTATVAGNLPNGPAEFYSYRYKRKGQSKKISRTSAGNYKNGFKEGKWVETESKGGKTIEHFKEGQRDGEYFLYNYKNQLTLRQKFRNGNQVDTACHYEDGKLAFYYDIRNRETDTIFPEENFRDFIFTEHGLGSWLRSYRIPKTFYVELYPDGKIKNRVSFSNSKNPVFDTLKRYNGDVLTITEASDEKGPYYVLRTVRISKYFREENNYFYRSKKLFRKEEKEWYRKAPEPYITVQTYADIDKIDPLSWKDTVISTLTYGKKMKFEIRHHLIPAMGYVWKEDRDGSTDQKPVSVDTLEREVFSRDTLGKPWEEIRVAQETKFWEADREDRKWERYNTRKKFGFLPAVRDISTWYYFTDNVTYNENYEFKNSTGEFSGTAWGVTWLQKGKPISGQHVFASEHRTLRKNKFKTPAHFYSEGGGSAEMGFLMNGVKNGRWEKLKLNRNKHISDNFEKSFRYKPRGGEYYIVADFKDGEADGIMRSWATEARIDGESRKLAYKLYTFMDYEASYSEGYLHGPYKTFHHNGKLKFSTTLYRGRLDGPAEFFSADGKLVKFASFKKDTLHGPYAEYVDGVLNVAANFEDNNLQGNFLVFSQKGDTLMKVSADKNIMRNKKLYFDNGKIKEELLFEERSKIEFSRYMASFESYLELDKKGRLKEEAGSMQALHKTYFENGQLLCQGKIEKGSPAGNWKFYNVAGVMTNDVFFKDSLVLFPGEKDSTEISGRITGYFNNGKMRCKGYVLGWESGYDCSAHQDKTKFEIRYTDTWTYDGEPVIQKGNGKGTIFDENGNKLEAGEFVNYQREGIWKFFDPNQKLAETGKYVNGKKHGLWYSGDLENLNFEDGACFDANSPEQQKMFSYLQKQLRCSAEIYKDGRMISSQRFETNMSTSKDYSNYNSYKLRRRSRRTIVDF